jgi:hypothetical protein
MPANGDIDCAPTLRVHAEALHRDDALMDSSNNILRWQQSFLWSLACCLYPPTIMLTVGSAGGAAVAILLSPFSLLFWARERSVEEMICAC